MASSIRQSQKPILDRLARAVGILDSKEKMAHFYDMAAAALKSVPVDLADIISKKDDAVPLMLRTIGNKVSLNRKLMK